MADHPAENILVEVVSRLTGLTTTGSHVFRGRVYELADTDLPGVCVYQGTDSPRSDGGSSSWKLVDSELSINVEAVVKSSAAQVETTLNQIRYEVAQALQEDVTQGLSYVLNTTEGSAIMDLDGTGEKIVGRMRMEWVILYRRQRYIAPVVPASGYPLDDDGSLATTFGYGALTMTAPDYNEGQHTYSGSTPGGAAVGLPSAANYLGAQAFIVDSDSVLHIEVEPIVPSCYEAGVQGFPLLGLGLIMSTGGVFGGLFGTVGIHDDDGSTPIYRGSLITDTVRATADGPVRMSLDLDGSDGSVTIRTTDGGTIVSATTFTPGTAFTPYLFVSDGSAPLSGNVVISLIPHAANAALPHNAGAVDLLGVVL